jgi:hypothetical protein
MMLFFLFACVTKIVQGTVLSSQGIPLQNATVTLAEQTVQTDQNGTYELKQLSLNKGEHLISITHENHIFLHSPQDIYGKQIIIPPLQLTPIEVEVPYPEIPLDTIIGE